MKKLIIISIAILLIAFTAWAGPKVAPNGLSSIGLGGGLGVFNNVDGSPAVPGEHYLLIDNASHYLLIDNASHKLRIDGNDA